MLIRSSSIGKWLQSIKMGICWHFKAGLGLTGKGGLPSIPSTKKTMVLKAYMASFHGKVADEFQAVNQLIISSLKSEVGLVENIGHYIVDSGGKRLQIGRAHV